MVMSPEVLRVENFCKSFKTKKVHRYLNLSLRKSECLGLIGGSGTGKSVLLRSLIGLEKPDEGEIFYHGERIDQLDERQWIPIRKKIAYAFQGGALFDSMTVFENLAYPLRAHTDLSEKQISEKIFETLEHFGMIESINLLPGSLSGGMQKRIGLARAMILRPEVVLYDEPTAGLDPYNTKKIEDMILKLKAEGVTSMLVTHDMPVAFKVCDRIALLKNQTIQFVCDPNDPNDPNLAFLIDFAGGIF
jgi:phospholipid/cholesterol/gamma-HCH transport system ATP-binding protein